MPTWEYIPDEQILTFYHPVRIVVSGRRLLLYLEDGVVFSYDLAASTFRSGTRPVYLGGTYYCLCLGSAGSRTETEFEISTDPERFEEFYAKLEALAAEARSESRSEAGLTRVQAGEARVDIRKGLFISKKQLRIFFLFFFAALIVGTQLLVQDWTGGQAALPPDPADAVELALSEARHWLNGRVLWSLSIAAFGAILYAYLASENTTGPAPLKVRVEPGALLLVRADGSAEKFDYAEHNFFITEFSNIPGLHVLNIGCYLEIFAAGELVFKALLRRGPNTTLLRRTLGAALREFRAAEDSRALAANGRPLR